MFLRIILAIVLPPLAVYLTSGLSVSLIINILLTLVGWLPGVIHAAWVISKDAEDAEDAEGETS